MPGTDVLVVTVGTTAGWHATARELGASIRRAGARAEVVSAAPAPRVRTFALTDLVEARLSRAAAQRAIAEHEPKAIVYCSITSALLWPRPGAIYLDSVAAENRPGHHGLWQRPVERRRLSQAPLVLPWTERTLIPLCSPPPEQRTVIVPPPVEGHPQPGVERDVLAVTYAGNPVKRRLPLVLETWSRVRRPDETLVVVGTDTIASSPGVEVAGRLPEPEFRALLARARAFIAAPQREDFGISALEALALGCQLVTTPSPGPYPALQLARRIDERLVGDDLTAPIRTALDDPRPDYVERAQELLAPFRREAIDGTIAERVLPRLLSG